MSINKKIILFFFLFSYLILGIFFSIKAGLSHDEFHEQLNWEFNLALIKNILFNVELDSMYQNYMETYHGIFHGIGFHLISQPLQFLLKNIILNYENVDNHAAHLLGKHVAIFFSFFISGIFFYLIIYKIVKNNIFCLFITTFYLMYPYLLGHSFFNPKDIPFLSFWIICTYFSFTLFEKLCNDEYITYTDVIIISFLTSFLLSIRITGILILFQYLISFIIFINLNPIKFNIFIRKFGNKTILFSFLIILFTYLLYPVFWKNPLLFIESVNYLGHFFHDICTLTLGKCISATNLDPTYIPIWFLVKIPLIILIGLFLLPFSEKKIFVSKKNNIFFGTILLTTFCIPLFLIFGEASLYDEIRHIMFLIPFIFILGSISFYIFSKKIFYFLGVVTLFIFLIENILIHPYQYVWFNSPSRILNLGENFELDYWGISSRNLAKRANNMKLNQNKDPCILIGVWSTKSYLDDNVFECTGAWSAIDSNFPRPFFAIQNVRNLRKGRSYRCQSIYDEKIKLLPFNQELLMGKLIKCD